MTRKTALGAVIGIVMLAVACQGVGKAAEPEQPSSAVEPVAAAAPTPVPTAIPPGPAPLPHPTPGQTPAPNPSPAPSPAVVPSPAPTADPARLLAEPEEAPARLTRGWATDFSKHSAPFSEILSGGPPRDGIPPIDSPVFLDVSDAPDYLEDAAPVVSLEINGEARAYPLAIMIWHEIVNDEVGGVPVSVTYCPLCNTAIVFDRRVNDTVLDFGTTGKLRNSDLVMWDRQTESWWQQITGEAIIGELTGTVLEFIPASLVSWAAFAEANPEGRVLSRETGFSRDYYRPPYGDYDAVGSTPFLFSGQIDKRLEAMERVVGLTVDGEAVAYPFPLFSDTPVVNDKVGTQDIVIFFASDTLSAFRGVGSESRAVGSTGVYDPNLDGQKLSFRQDGASIVDDTTGSTWNILGEAIDGPLAGQSLTPVVHANHFWFAWAAFYPETDVRSAVDISGQG